MDGADGFVHLHVHSNFSFGDGACRIDELVDAARAMGMKALAVTDHEGLYGAVRFYEACQKAGIKPIVGVELTVESVLDADGESGSGDAPLPVLATTAQGAWRSRGSTTGDEGPAGGGDPAAQPPGAGAAPAPGLPREVRAARG